MGRAPRTKETLPDFREKCRVTRQSRVFRGLTLVNGPPGFGVSHVREAGVNVERVLSEEVHSESFSQDTMDSFQPAVTSRPSFDSSVEHSSRPSFAGTSTTGYDGSIGEGINDGSDTGNDDGDIADPQQSQYPLSPFTDEDDFTHATQDEDHGSRRAGPGIGATGKPHRGRQ